MTASRTRKKKDDPTILLITGITIREKKTHGGLNRGSEPI